MGWGGRLSRGGGWFGVCPRLRLALSRKASAQWDGGDRGGDRRASAYVTLRRDKEGGGQTGKWKSERRKEPRDKRLKDQETKRRGMRPEGGERRPETLKGAPVKYALHFTG